MFALYSISQTHLPAHPFALLATHGPNVHQHVRANTRCRIYVSSDPISCLAFRGDGWAGRVRVHPCVPRNCIGTSYAWKVCGWVGGYPAKHALRIAIGIADMPGTTTPRDAIGLLLRLVRSCVPLCRATVRQQVFANRL